MSVQSTEQFWNLFTRVGSCLIWTGAVGTNGYGRVTYKGRRDRTHRIAYELSKGAIPKGKHVCHDCPTGDNPLCGEPSHLWLGSAAQNSVDMWRKGRARPVTKTNGVGHRAIVTPEQVVAIRARYAVGDITTARLGAEYGIKSSAVVSITTRRNWRHIP